MKIDKAIASVKPHLTEERFDHTLRVKETALELAKIYNEPKDEVELAAVFHDYAKYRPLAEMENWIKKSSLPNDLLKYDHELWHGPVGSILVEHEYGITDNAVRSAIRYHTTGKANMSQLDMIIFLADYIEPNRNFPGLKEIREIAPNNLLHACWMVSRNTIQFLIQKNKQIYSDAFHAYNDLTRQIGQHNL